MRQRFLIRALFVIALSLTPVALVKAGPTSKRGSGSAPVLNEDAAQRAGLSAQDVSDASRLYTAKCMRCHKSYEPAAYAQPEWTTWMTKMRKKAHLASGQEQLLSRYLDAYRLGHSLLKTNAVANDSALMSR